MKIPIKDAATIGQVVKASRKAQKVRQDDAAGGIGVSENFLGKVEHGSPNIQWGKLFDVCAGLGIHIEVDVPQNVFEHWVKQHSLTKPVKNKKNEREKTSVKGSAS